MLNVDQKEEGGSDEEHGNPNGKSLQNVVERTIRSPGEAWNRQS